jgi:thiosulfate reductase cytochrome b subunit
VHSERQRGDKFGAEKRQSPLREINILAKWRMYEMHLTTITLFPNKETSHFWVRFGRSKSMFRLVACVVGYIVILLSGKHVLESPAKFMKTNNTVPVQFFVFIL